MYSVISVADEILRVAKRNGRELTPMQLVKLAFITHGWYLAHTDQPLFYDDIEAWKYGPVIPELYQATKRWGRKPIPLDCVNDRPSVALEPLAQECVEVIFKAYGHMTGPQLSNLTHKLGSPWDQVFCQGVFNIPISNRSIKDYYKRQMGERV